MSALAAIFGGKKAAENDTQLQVQAAFDRAHDQKLDEQEETNLAMPTTKKAKRANGVHKSGLLNDTMEVRALTGNLNLAGMKKTQTLSPRSLMDPPLERRQTFDAVTNVAVRLQSAIRSWLVRRELKNAQLDKDLELRRKTLIFNLHTLGASRRSLLSFIGYVCLMATFLTLLFGGYSSSTEYEVAGYVKDTLMGNYWSSGNTGYDVRSRPDIYGFIENSVIGGHYRLNQTATSLNMYNPEHMAGSVLVVIERGTVVNCNTLYPEQTGGSFFPDFQSGNCLTETVSEDTVRTNLGNQYDDHVESDYGDWSASTSGFWASGDAELFRNSSACPLLIYYNNWGIKKGHTIPLAANLRPEDWKTVFDVMKNCEVLDASTRKVHMEIGWISGNLYPYFCQLVVSFEISLGGQISVKEELMSASLVAASSNKHRKVEYSCQIALLVGAVTALVLVGLDFISNALYYQQLYLWFWLRDVWNYGNIGTYVILIVQAQSYFGIDTLRGELLETVNVNQFVQKLNNLHIDSQAYKVQLGVAALMLVLKFFYHFRHRGMFSMLTKALYHVLVPLGHFVFSLGVVMVAFATAGFAIFGPVTYSFSTFILSIETLLNMTFGDFNYEELKRVNQTIAFLYFYSFMILMVLILLNFFIAIIMEGYSVVFSRGDVNVPLWKFTWSNVHAVRQAFTGKTTSSDEIAWVLRHDPAYNRRKLISLFIIRRISTAPLSAECAQVIFDMLVESGVEPDDALRAYGSPYSYMCSDDYGDLKQKYARRVPLCCLRNGAAVALLHISSWITTRILASQQQSRRKKSKKRRERVQRQKTKLKAPSHDSVPHGDGADHVVDIVASGAPVAAESDVPATKRPGLFSRKKGVK